MTPAIKSNILIVDDEESIRVNFRAFLEDVGHHVETAEDYNSAMEIIENKNIDLVIADIILGYHTGIDILRAVKKVNSHCPVIIITGAPNIETATEAVRLGSFDYLTKPIRKTMLLKVVRQALYQKSIEDEKQRYRSNLEAIFRSLESAIITVDNELRVIEVNNAIQKICGLSPNEFKGNIFNKIQIPCSKSCHTALIETIKNKATIKELRVHCKHNRHLDQVVVISSSPLLNQDNKSNGSVMLIRDVTRLAKLERELSERHKFCNIIGKSKKMQDLFKLIEDLSDFDTTVLVTGESGTGKELVSNALHHNGTRSAKPFVKVNCSALAENLLESELFGHIKGAFTGAGSDRAGRFELADGGTILLDEIGDISLSIQQKLLRVLQEKTFERVGDSMSLKVDVRVIAATNSDLKQKIKAGTFREDLYYRLKVIVIDLPPLRERVEDIPFLIDHFCLLFNRKFTKNIEKFDDELLDIFMRYPWPGNIRELEHTLEHAFILCHSSIIKADHLPLEIKNFSFQKGLDASLDPQDEHQKIIKALNDTSWNKAKAARILRISRPTLYSKMEKHNITPHNMY
jgi:two-component system, NtrC family, response regulator HydG